MPPIARILRNNAEFLDTTLGQIACFLQNSFCAPALNGAPQARNHAEGTGVAAAFGQAQCSCSAGHFARQGFVRIQVTSRFGAVDKSGPGFGEQIGDLRQLAGT